ncbi:MAG: hypothetical protein ABIR78_12125, partial [Ferruginibacter sp.]
TAGGVQLTGIGEAANRVLSSDAAGNATWNTLATVGGVSGSGTLNFLSKWTPNGTTLGNSLVFDNGTAVGINTTTPNATFDIQNASATLRGALINNTDLTNNSSSLLVGRSNITGAGSVEGSALSAYLTPFVGTTWTLGTPVAAKSFASPNATVGFGGGTGFMGSSSSGMGVVGLTNSGTAVYGWALGGGYALQTDGKVQIIGQGAAAGKVLTSDAAGNATWQNLITPNVGIALRTVTGPTSFPVGTSDVTTWATVVHENGGANYDGAGGYTITVSGVYQINASMSFQPANPGFISIQTSVNGGTDNENAVTVAVVGQYMMPQLSYLRQLVAGDIVRVRINNGTGATQAPNTGFLANNFSLQLIHN